jgi:ATP-dependent Zn protease
MRHPRGPQRHFWGYPKVRVEEILRENWNLLAALAEQILQQETLDGATITEFIRSEF